jgi:prepilin-type N-terminal cleavage/methylation domain-containing protein
MTSPRQDVTGRAISRRRGRAAFSLIELIIVIGIITILMAFLLPALKVANEAARVTQCASQLRQIGQAIFNYAANHRGLTPPWGAGIANYGGTVFDPIDRGWCAMLRQYTGVRANTPLYHCPAFPVDDETNTYFISARWGRLQSPQRRSIALSRIRLSSQFVLAGEATGIGGYIPPFGTDADPRDNTDKDDSGKRRLVFFGESGGYNMHRAGNNALFADSHVQVFKNSIPSPSPTAPTAWKTGTKSPAGETPQHPQLGQCVRPAFRHRLASSHGKETCGVKAVAASNSARPSALLDTPFVYCSEKFNCATFGLRRTRDSSRQPFFDARQAIFIIDLRAVVAFAARDAVDVRDD